MKKDQEVMNKNNEFNVEEDMPNLTSDLGERKEKNLEQHCSKVKDVKHSKSKKKQSYNFQRIENVDVKTGLSSEEANLRILNHYNNENNVKTTKSAWQIIRENLFSFFK